MVHSKVSIKGLGGGKKRLPHNIVDLVPDILTNPDMLFNTYTMLFNENICCSFCPCLY